MSDPNPNPAPPADPPAPPTPPPADPPAPPAGDPAQRVEDLPDWAQKVIRETRAEAAQHRTGRTAAEQQAQQAAAVVEAINKALNPGQEADPAKLAEQLEAQRAEVRSLKVDNALSAALSAHKADPDLTRAVLAASGQLGQLDPSAADFAQQLDALVKGAVESNPKLKAGQAPPRSGGEFTGGTGGAPQQVTEQQLATMTPEQIVAARREGRLANLL